MTLERLKLKWKTELDNWTVQNLKSDDEFMADSTNYPEFAAYVLRVKPKMRRDRPPKMKFLGLDHSKVPVEPESPVIEPGPVEEISKTGQIIKDLNEYRKNQGFI